LTSKDDLYEAINKNWLLYYHFIIILYNYHYYY
jgi:hypothetical protein